MGLTDGVSTLQLTSLRISSGDWQLIKEALSASKLGKPWGPCDLGSASSKLRTRTSSREWKAVLTGGLCCKSLQGERGGYVEKLELSDYKGHGSAV